MKKNKLMITSIIASIISISSLTILSSASCSCSSDTNKVESFKINNTSTVMSKDLENAFSFTLKTASDDNVDVKAVDKNNVTLEDIIITLQNDNSKFTGTIKKTSSPADYTISFVIVLNKEEIFKSPLATMSFLDEPYSYAFSEGVFGLDADKNLKGIFTTTAPGTFPSSNLVVGSVFEGTLLKKLDSSDRYHLYAQNRSILKKIYVNSKASDYSGQSAITGLEIGYQFFSNMFAPNVSYIFVGSGVNKIGYGSFSDISNAWPDPGVPLTMEFDFPVLSKVSIDPSWYKGSCGQDLTDVLSKVIIPNGSSIDDWASALAIDKSLIYVKGTKTR